MIGNPSLVNFEIPDVVAKLRLSTIFDDNITECVGGSAASNGNLLLNIGEYLRIRNEKGYNIEGLNSNTVDYIDSIINDLIDCTDSNQISWYNFCGKRGMVYFDEKFDEKVLENINNLLTRVYYIKLDEQDYIKANIFKKRIYSKYKDTISYSEIGSTYNLSAESIRRKENEMLDNLQDALLNKYLVVKAGFIVSQKFSEELNMIYAQLSGIHRVGAQELLLYLTTKFKAPKNVINKYIYIFHIIFKGHNKITKELLQKKPFF